MSDRNIILFQLSSNGVFHPEMQLPSGPDGDLVRDGNLTFGGFGPQRRGDRIFIHGKTPDIQASSANFSKRSTSERTSSIPIAAGNDVCGLGAEGRISQAFVTAEETTL